MKPVGRNTHDPISNLKKYVISLLDPFPFFNSFSFAFSQLDLDLPKASNLSPLLLPQSVKTLTFYFFPTLPQGRIEGGTAPQGF